MVCDSVLHKMHICALVAENAELVKKLAENPEFECGHCGALAKDPKNVCSPRKISQSD